MIINSSTRAHIGSVLTTLAITLAVYVASSAFQPLRAQQPQSGPQVPSAAEVVRLKQEVERLKNQTKQTEIVPLLEKILAAEPENAQMHFYLGFGLLGQAANTTDPGQRKALRVRSRNEFIRARELNVNEPVVEALIVSIPEDGADATAFSEDVRANALMIQAEALFSQGKLDQALQNYQMALASDPKLYHAALFSGDVYTQQGDFSKAELWYQKAIAIDPTLETAYRYSATPLMKQGKTQDALLRYIEAFITQPYNRFAVAGLTQWATITHTSLSHPKIDIQSNDESRPWSVYRATRSTWQNEKFARTFPAEKTYRHSLPEEADALRSVLAAASSEQLNNSSLGILKKLNDEGLLEAYILLARADEGISNDHPTYLQKNRDQLRQYVVKYVVGDK